MQNKTTMKYHYTTIIMAKIIKIMTTPNADENVRQQELSFIVSGNAKCYSHFGKEFGSVLVHSLIV